VLLSISPVQRLDAASVFAPQVTPQVTPQVRRMHEIMQGKMTREAMQSALNLRDRKSFRQRYLLPALVEGLIEMTIPDRPNSRLQKYRLTGKGQQMAAQSEAPP
jgi:hypothetical protein